MTIDTAVGSLVLNVLWTVGERRCGYRLTQMGAGSQWLLGAELWVAVRLTGNVQPLSNEKRQRILVQTKGRLHHPDAVCCP